MVETASYETWSAFLLNGKTSRSGGTANGTGIPTGNFSEKKELHSSFLVFTGEMTKYY